MPFGELFGHPQFSNFQNGPLLLLSLATSWDKLMRPIRDKPREKVGQTKTEEEGVHYQHTHAILEQEEACSADITRILMRTFWQEMACSADITRIPIPLQNQSSQSHKQRRQSQHVAQPYLPSRALTANLGA